MTATYLAQNGVGVRYSTYTRYMYLIYTGSKDYRILHTATFGSN